MVDGAITADLLHLARTDKDSLLVAVCDDDDLLPGVITASAWKCSAFIARPSDRVNPHLDGSLIKELRI